MDKLWSCDSTKLLREINRKMSIIESILRQVSGEWITEEVYEIPHMLLEVSKLLLTLQQNSKMTPLAKGLSLQLQNIQEQHDRLFYRGEVNNLPPE